MAKVKLGAMVTAISGKTGSSVFMSRSGKTQVRNNTTIKSRTSNRFQLSRKAYGVLSATYKTLTAAQRASWEIASAQWTQNDLFGNVVKPSGLNLYLKLNLYIWLESRTLLVLPPLPIQPTIYTITSFTFSRTATSISIGTSPGAIPANSSYYVRMSPWVSKGVSAITNKCRFIGFRASDGSPPNYYNNYVAIFGAPPIGAKVFMENFSFHWLTGQTSLPYPASTIVT